MPCILATPHLCLHSMTVPFVWQRMQSRRSLEEARSHSYFLLNSELSALVVTNLDVQRRLWHLCPSRMPDQTGGLSSNMSL